MSFLILGISFSEKNPLGKASSSMKPIEEAMEDDVFEVDSANDSQNSPLQVQDDISGDLQPQLIFGGPLCDDGVDCYRSVITSGAGLLGYYTGQTACPSRDSFCETMIASYHRMCLF